MNPGVMMGSHEGMKTRNGEETARRLKYVCRLGYGDSLPKDEESSGDIPVFGSNGQYSTTSERNTSAPAIVLGRKGSYGKVNWAPEGCFASDTTFYIDSNQSASNLRWLYWALQTLKLDEGSQEAAVPGLNRESVYEQRVIYPDNETQRLIADYLDRETARIDALVAEKEKMLALLEEKRAALISRAVTRGLDPTAPLKPSGLDWLGDIPAHWETRTLKKVSLRIDTGSTPSASYMDGTLLPQFLWFTPGDFENGGELIDSKRKIPIEAIEDKEAKVFPANAIMVIGIGATLGKVATSSVEFSANQQINVIYPSEETSSEFLLYALQGYEKVFRANANSATLPILNQERLGAIHIPFPPMEEQLLIAGKIREKKAAERKITEQLISSISLLKERRAALITAAVTGQIPAKEMRG